MAAKFGFYSKDFVNIGENFARLNEGQNKLVSALNQYDNEFAKMR